MTSRRRWAIGLLALIGLAAAAPIAAYAAPSLVGADSARIVLTGSMEPALAPGDVGFLEEDVTLEDVAVGDVITFKAHAKAETTYTHRVVEKTDNTAGPVLVTKGDANEDPDPMHVDEAMLVGRVDQSLPAYGKAIAASEEIPLGLVLAVLSLVTVTHEVIALREDEQPTSFDPVDNGNEKEPTRFEVVR